LVSEDQVAMATQNCGEYPHVECQVANVLEIPYEDVRFDAVYGVQVLEYVPELGKALSEIHRVLKRGGRFVLLATNWNSLVWHSGNPERMQKILHAFEKHAPFPNLPSILPTKLRQGGFQVTRQLPVTVLNTSSSENSFSQYLTPMVKGFVQSQGLVPEDELEAWAKELAELNEKGEYWFGSTTVITEAFKPA
jgi:arsenite methyltransferase